MAGAMVLAMTSGASAQIGSIGSGLLKAKQIADIKISDEEEVEIGRLVSEKIRQRYGVVQDKAVHRYVSLVGLALVTSGTRATLPWQFIVLDTDGVNAFAAPGGYVHITRGALGLIRSEAELAGVLAHEIVHVTEKHTINAIKKNKAVQMGTSEALGDKALYLDAVANKAYEMLLENAYDRGDEQESDKIGIRLANKIGYAPSGLGAFLQKLGDRNKDAKEKRGLFASHPDLQERITKLTRQITSEKLTSAATVEARYLKFIPYEAKAQADIATVVSGSAGVAGGTTKAEEPKKEEEKKKGFGLGSLVKPAGSEKQSAQVTASAGARGVDPERDARGGSNPKAVVVALTAAEIAEFKKGIAA
jgi:predicted Zn-dependent protease